MHNDWKLDAFLVTLAVSMGLFMFYCSGANGANYLNGKEIGDFIISNDGEDTHIRYEDLEAPPVDPVPPPSGQCDWTGINPNFGPIAVENPWSQTFVPLGNKVGSARLTNEANELVNGSFSFAAATGTSGVIRKAWISECPGQPPLEGKGICEVRGTSSTNLMFTTGPWEFNKCKLRFDQSKLFLNVQNENCSDNRCGVHLNIYK